MEMESLWSGKKHKKHKRDRYESGERTCALKLILKVGNRSTPEPSGRLSPQHSQSSKRAKKKKRKKDKRERRKRHKDKDKRKRYRTPPPVPATAEDSIGDAVDRTEEGQEAPGREPRIRVARRKQERTPLQKTLEYLHRQLEKKDPHTFFAWPVTDQIAPGYSKTISRPMDFSTMKQKIDDDEYTSLDDYTEDFRLMCDNAMTYNHAETIYYKAAKRLLHAGLKLLDPEKLARLVGSVPGVTSPSPAPRSDAPKPEEEEKDDGEERPPAENHTRPKDDAILRQARKAAEAAADKLSLKRPKTGMGFLRRQTDGSTSLALLIPGEGVHPDRPTERSVSLGQLVGKLTHGSGQLQGFREDRRNVAKPVKSLNYGAFGSYAPSYDSTFANISKEESDLLYRTYGDDNATAYAESVLNFAKDCDYTLTVVDNLLDVLTDGEHGRTKSIIDEHRKFREEEQRVKELMETEPHRPPARPQQSPTTPDSQTKLDLDQLKTLTDIGIDMSFLNSWNQNGTTSGGGKTSGVRRSSSNGGEAVQEKLDETRGLIERLQEVQNERLSSVPPSHLSQVLPPSDTELNLADKITDGLTQLAKQVPPGVIIPVPAVRKAMGIVPVVEAVSSISEEENCTVSQLDLESELREFLESDSALSSFPLQDDKTIEEMLCEP